MSPLPKFVRSLPKVFYALAVVFFLWRFWNEYAIAKQSIAYESAIDTSTPMFKAAISGALYWAFVEAAYMVANGAVIQVLISIYDKVRGAE